MSGIKIFVRNEADKKSLIEDYLQEDNLYLEALEKLKTGFIGQGIDISRGEGRRAFIEAVRRFNENFGKTA
ncbi:MAG: hypothetical protein M0Z79_10900 [Nitrospiraceae bacterium]|nr:hypothetical protein [Nitrospiraceae bacterium]